MVSYNSEIRDTHDEIGVERPGGGGAVALTSVSSWRTKLFKALLSPSSQSWNYCEGMRNGLFVC